MARYSECLEKYNLEDTPQNRIAFEVANLSHRLDILEKFLAKEYGPRPELDPEVTDMETTPEGFISTQELLFNMGLPTL